MNIITQRPQRRPKLFLPLALTAPPRPAETGAQAAFPLSPDLLRRTVAEMIG